MIEKKLILMTTDAKTIFTFIVGYYYSILEIEQIEAIR